MGDDEKPQVNRQALDSEPRDDRDDDGGSNSGSYGVAIFGLIVLYLVVASIVGYAMSNNNTPPPTPTCTSACYGFVKLECPTHRFMGGCFDVPWCSGATHICGKDQ